MSIYCSIFDFGFEHSPRCKRIKKIRPKEYEQDDSKPCTCGSCPIEYLGSHIFPTARDNRDGCFGLAAIPSHITRDGKDDRPEGKWHPWLRVSLREKDTAILTRKQVEKLRDALTGWLERS